MYFPKWTWYLFSWEYYLGLVKKWILSGKMFGISRSINCLIFKIGGFIHSCIYSFWVLFIPYFESKLLLGARHCDAVVAQNSRGCPSIGWELTHILSILNIKFNISNLWMLLWDLPSTSWAWTRTKKQIRAVCWINTDLAGVI